MIGASAGKNKSQKTSGSRKGIFCEGKEVRLELGVQRVWEMKFWHFAF